MSFEKNLLWKALTALMLSWTQIHSDLKKLLWHLYDEYVLFLWALFIFQRDKYSPLLCADGKKTAPMFDANMLCPFIVSLDNMQYCVRFNKSLLAAHLSHNICIYMYSKTKIYFFFVKWVLLRLFALYFNNYLKLGSICTANITT